MKIIVKIGKLIGVFIGLIVSLFMYNKYTKENVSSAEKHDAKETIHYSDKTCTENAKEFLSIVELLNKIYS